MPQEGDATVERPLVDGRYALIAPLGRGGFGTVYRARDTLLQRDVAIKLLGSVSADRRERFLREARAMAKLHHPNIVDIYDAGEDEHGLYLVLELIDGRALSDTVPVERSRARSIVREVASALAAAHDAGIVHRDIKPANILIDGNGHAKVTDFGVARLAEDPTVTGKVIGTPAYMAPEQLAGRPVGPAADLYALGVVMRELGIGEGKLLDPDPQKRGTARDVNGARPKRGWQVAFAAAVILAAIVIASRKPKPVVDVQQQNLLTALAGSDFRKEPNLFTGPAPSSRKISYSGSVRASDFLALVARATKWPLVQDNSVAQVSRASIPLEVTNAAWDEVARNIIDTLGLSLSRDGDIWIVESQQRRRERE
ncbi:MAG TPA: serine/threonine-protein kinase, partial [Thermoanaerobaculia bacterium]